MSAKSAQAMQDTVLDAALIVAQDAPWTDISAIEIAQQAQISLSDFYAVFSDKRDILPALSRRLGAQIEAQAGSFSHRDSCRDRLFDLLMERFELINVHRAAYKSMLSDVLCDGKEAVMNMPYLARSMEQMLLLSGMKTVGLRGGVRIMGLVGLYLYALKIWAEDESPDMARVMAGLDRGLATLEKTANILSI